MLTVVKNNLSLMKTYFFLNLSASMEYRTSFLIQMVGMMLNNVSFAFFWWLLFWRFPDIGGYGYGDVMMLWAISSAGFGGCFILFGNSRRLVEMIVTGELDSYLLQPKHVLLNAISSKTVISAWGDLVYGVILFFIIKGLDIGALLLFIIFTMTAALIFGAVVVSFNALAFWFGDVRSLGGLVLEFMVTFTIYPAGIFDGFAKFILFSVLPAGFVTMVPVQVMQAFDPKWVILTLFVTVVWVFLAFFIFDKGLKKYESGNLIVQKM